MKTWNMIYARPLITEWILELAIAGSAAAALSSFSNGAIRVRDVAGFFVYFVLYGLCSMAIRMPVHIWWAAYIRYRLAKANGFRLWVTVTTLAWTYWGALFLTVSAHDILRGYPGTYNVYSLVGVVLFAAPSFGAAILAPCLLHWCGYRIFDARVADNAAKDRADMAAHDRP